MKLEWPLKTGYVKRSDGDLQGDFLEKVAVVPETGSISGGRARHNQGFSTVLSLRGGISAVTERKNT